MNDITPCPCCGAPSALRFVSGDRNRHLSDETFSYYTCSGCGLVFIDPVPAGLGRYYEGGYQPIPADVDALRALATPERYRLAPILAEHRGGDLLEIGPWIGLFSLNAKEAGFNVDAIEMSPEATRFLREEVGITVVNTADPVAALQAPKRYDVIALWHSLEHLPRPWAVLEAAAQRLKPGGVLLVAIPNIDGRQSEILGRRWLHLDAPRHLYFWSPQALEALIHRFGLKTVKIDTGDRLSRVLSEGAWNHYFQRLVPVKYLRTAVYRLLTPIARLYSERPGRGAGITAVFKAP